MSAYILDCELTDRRDGEIIEVAWIRIAADADLFPGGDRISTNLTVEELHVQRYRPSKPITHGAMAVHHILTHELENSPPSSSFLLPIQMQYMIGHTIDTDWVAVGSPPDILRIDTHAIAQHEWPDATGFGQVALMYRLFGEREETRAMVQNAHGASADVVMNRLLLREILRLHPEITTWSQLHEYSEECRVPLTCPLKRWEGVKLTEMEDSAIDWLLSRHWIDPYLRKGLQRVMDARYPPDADDDESSDDHRSQEDEDVDSAA